MILMGKYFKCLVYQFSFYSNIEEEENYLFSFFKNLFFSFFRKYTLYF